MAAIRGLIRLFPGQLVQGNLPRAASFLVAESGDRIIGCCALQVYSKRLAEVRSLAVHHDFHERGVASKLVEGCIGRARARGVNELFAVTSQRSFFERLGFATFRREKIAMFFEVRRAPEGTADLVRAGLGPISSAPRPASGRFVGSPLMKR